MEFFPMELGRGRGRVKPLLILNRRNFSLGPSSESHLTHMVYFLSLWEYHTHPQHLRQLDRKYWGLGCHDWCVTEQEVLWRAVSKGRSVQTLKWTPNSLLQAHLHQCDTPSWNTEPTMHEPHPWTYRVGGWEGERGGVRERMSKLEPEVAFISKTFCMGSS